MDQREIHRPVRSRTALLFLLCTLVAGAEAVSCATGCSAPDAGRLDAEKGSVNRERISRGNTLVGTGCVATTADPAADRMSADELARAEVAKQIRVKVVQLVEDIQKEEKKDGQIKGSYSVTVKTREMVYRNLQGVSIVERTHDEATGMTCSVAVLDKAAMASRIRAELKKTLRETSAHLTAADLAEQEGNPTEALRGRTLALLNLTPASVEAGLLRDLGQAPPPMPARADIWKEWMKTLQGIRIAVTGGNRQKGQPGKPLPSPVTLRVVMNGTVPASDLPLKVLRAPARLDLQQEVRTDETGEASLLVIRVPAGRKAIQQIVLGLDWEKLLQGKTDDAGEPPWTDWDTRETVITYLLPVPGDFSVGVAVYDAETGRAMPRSPLQTALQEGLQKTGFVTRDIFALPGDLSRAFSQKPSLEEARRRLQGRVDILVLGDVSVGDPRKSSYDFVFCRSRMMVQGVSLSTGRTLVSLEVNAKGGALDNQTAVRKSMEGLGKKLRKELGEKLADALP